MTCFAFLGTVSLIDVCRGILARCPVATAGLPVLVLHYVFAGLLCTLGEEISS